VLTRAQRIFAPDPCQRQGSSSKGNQIPAARGRTARRHFVAGTHRLASRLVRGMHGQAHEGGREHDKDVALDQGNDDLQHEDADGNRDGRRGEH
jgi:hypothetical protein